MTQIMMEYLACAPYRAEYVTCVAKNHLTEVGRISAFSALSLKTYTAHKADRDGISFTYNLLFHLFGGLQM